MPPTLYDIFATLFYFILYSFFSKSNCDFFMRYKFPLVLVNATYNLLRIISDSGFSNSLEFIFSNFSINITQISLIALKLYFSLSLKFNFFH